MNKDFPRIITMLRKEKKLSQKEVASALEISQALLSHYENGLRECGLDFLIKIAEYYSVSCDFLLGRSPERTGATLNFDDIPDVDDDSSDIKKGSALVPILSKKILCNSLTIVYDILLRSKSKQLTADATSYLMLAVYKVFRTLYSANPDNFQTMFSINSELYRGYCDALMSIFSTKLELTASQSNSDSAAKELRALKSSAEILSQEYPNQSSSLLNLIQHAESKIKAKTR